MLLWWPSMASNGRQTEALRQQISRTIRRTTDLIADLKTLADGLDTLLPEGDNRTRTERWRETAQLAALDERAPERLEALVEALADVLAGLTEADNGAHWLAQQRARLAAGEDAAAA
ncbi:MAG TPA: hypothetical protein VFW70_11770 [Methylomirabilota bacterium]|nr:hypothetical protein [Methylomirabilota bacterium]